MALTDTGLQRPSAVVLRALALGDLLTAVPALRGVRAALPEHRVVLCAPSSLRPLLELSGAVDEVVDVRDLGSPLPSSLCGCDVAVNLHGSGPQSHDLLLDLQPGRLLAFAAAGVAGPQWVEHEHEVDRWRRLVSEGFGRTVPGDLQLSRPPVASPAAGAVVVHPGAAYASRRWPVERFGAVARVLAAQGHDVVVTGSPAERPGALAVASVAGLPDSAVLAGRTSLLELAALVADARMLVSGDTGVAHLATAYATASVVLFGPAPPARWRPRESRRHVVLWHGDPADPWAVGGPFADRPDPLLLKIEVDEVLAACAELEEGTSPP